MILAHENSFLLIILLIFINGCSLFSKNDTTTCQSDFVCTNAISDEWTHLGLGEEAVQTIAINPCNSAHILAGTAQSFSSGIQGKIFRSIDCGESWDQVWEGGSVSDLAFDPKNPNIVYASPHGMIRSMDGGKNWSIIDNGLEPHLSFTQRVASIAIDPKDTRRVYATTGGYGAGWLFYSDNRGNTWHPIPGRGDFQRDEDDNRYLNNDLPGPILIDPANPDVLYISPLDIRLLLKSKDRGMSWNLLLKEDAPALRHITFSHDHASIYSLVRRFDSLGGLFEGGLFEYNFQNGQTQLHPVSYDSDEKPQALDVFSAIGGLVVATDNGIYYSENGEWHVYTGEIISGYPNALKAHHNLIYSGIMPNNEFRSNGGIYVRLHK